MARIWPFRRRSAPPDPDPFRGGDPEQRAINFQDLWGMGANFQDLWGSGLDVGTRTTTVSLDRALSLTPVYAATSLIADLVSTCPIDVFRRTTDGAVPIDPKPTMLTRPTIFGSSVDWMHRAVVSMALRGNAYGFITGHDAMGYPTQIEWLHPDDVTVRDNLTEGPIQWYYRGRPVDSSLIVHVPYYTVPGFVLGLSPIKAYAMVVDTGLYAHHFGRDYFRNGSVPAGILKTEQRLDDETQIDVIKARFKRNAARREPVVLGSGLDYKPISVAPNESQFLETLRVTATQIAAIYHLHPEMIGGDQGRSASITYANVEQRAMETVKLALMPYMRRIEEALFPLLPGRQYLRFNVNSFVRADIASRYGAHSLALQDGWMSRDEVRAIEDLPPMPNGLGGFPKPVPATAPGVPPADGPGAPAPPAGANAPPPKHALPKAPVGEPSSSEPGAGGSRGNGHQPATGGRVLSGWDPLIALHGRRSDPWI